MHDKTILDDAKAATAIEYSLIMALIAVSAIAAMQGVGSRVFAVFMVIAEALGFGGLGGVSDGLIPPDV